MSNTAHASISIQASPAKVWDALINPAVIKQYMFGTEAVSDWKKGGTVVYCGEWEGEPYEDTGIILVIEPEKRIVMDYSSSFSGDTDNPQNHRVLTYLLEAQDGQTVLTVTQDNNPSEEAAVESTQSWQSILQTIKKLLEV